jgi:hypothetical protein
MSSPIDPESAAGAPETGGARWNWQFGVVVALLGAFALLVVAMMWLADGEDLVWQRRLYVFGAVEAVVFTAVGWLFGREVNRTEARTARQDAAAAKEDAAAAQQQAAGERDRAAAAERAFTEERARGEAVQAAVGSMVTDSAPLSEGPVDAAGGPEAPPPAPQIDLRKFVTELYSDRRGG